MEARSQFTFYKSIFDSVSRIKKKADRADAYDIICAYALTGQEPDLEALSDAAAIAFISCKPNLDASRKKAASGKKGGNKKQTESKPEATQKQTEANGKLEETEREKEKENEKEKELEIENECYISGEQNSASPPPVICLPLNDGSKFEISAKQYQEWKSLYPAVDVMQQLRNMKGWLDANPKKRKTRRGIQSFCASWLSREQDRGGAKGISREQVRTMPNYDDGEKWGL